MKRARFIIAGFLLVLCCNASAIVVNHFPYEIRFDRISDTVGWYFASTDSAYTRQWVIDSLPGYSFLGEKCLFIEENGRFGFSQNRTQQYAVTAYCKLDGLPTGTYNISFRYRSTDRFTNHNFSYQIQNAAPTWELMHQWSGLHISLTQKEDFWQEEHTTFTASAALPTYIIFRSWVGSSATDTMRYIAPAIDAIQITPVYQDSTCLSTPTDLACSRIGNHEVFTWKGFGSNYELQYFMNDTPSAVFYDKRNITSTSDTILCDTLPEGSYTVRVRSICGTDTSAWESEDYQLIYDINKHCLDYLNFADSAVVGHIGYTFSSTFFKHIIDNGYKSESSRHTIHHIPHDLDKRTNYQMRTFPANQPAAIRLGNWQTSGEAEDMVYTLHVDNDKQLIKVQYALVMQLPGHNTVEQPRFQLQILDSIGTLIDSCAIVDLTDSVNLHGWDTAHVAGQTDIVWKDWSLMSFHIGQYAGRTIKIRVFNEDCNDGSHFGYGYFTLQCDYAQLDGIRCGEKPTEFTVDEGFKYRWYRKYDNPQVTLGTQSSYTLTSTTDTATYCVDLINLINPNCYFTMEASALAFMSEALGGWSFTQENCTNRVQFSDSSRTVGVYWENGSKVVVSSSDSVDSFYWDFGQYGISTEKNPELTVPQAGDTLRVVLHAFHKECEDSLVMMVPVPGIEPTRSSQSHTICQGASITIAGKTYSQQGNYTDTIKTETGCDSILEITIYNIVPDSIIYNPDTLCPSETPLIWREIEITESGTYISREEGITNHCDSIIHIKSVYVHPALDVSLSQSSIKFCQGDNGVVDIPVSVSSGRIASYDLTFDASLTSKGFQNQTGVPMTDDNILRLDFTGNTWPGQYNARLTLHDYVCDPVNMQMDFEIQYAPDSLITQRWNDLLAVRKTAYNFYGGFDSYQWYRDGQILSGETSSELYLPNEGLPQTSSYQVAVTRTVDRVCVSNCDFHPTLQPNTSTITVIPSHVQAEAPQSISITSSHNGVCQLYSSAGTLIAQWTIETGTSEFTLPSTPGIYILRTTLDDGTINNQKLMVE